MEKSQFKRIALNYWHNVESLGAVTLLYSPNGFTRWVHDLLGSVISVATALGVTDRGQGESLIKSVQNMEALSQKLMEQADAILPGSLPPMTQEELMEKLSGQEHVLPGVVRSGRSLAAINHARGLFERSVVVMLVSSFEVLLADVFHEFFRLHPKAIPGDDRHIRLEELKAFDSIEDVLRHHAEERVDSLLKGGPDKWATEVRNRLNVDLQSLVPVDWSDFKEMIQRRHIYVHNDGRVDKAYLARMRRSSVGVSEDLSVGQYLETTAEYVVNALETFTVAGLGLVDTVWARNAPGESLERDEVLYEVASKALHDEDYRLLIHVSDIALDRECSSVEKEHLFQINRWLGMKEVGRWEEVRKEAEAFDISSCPASTAAAVTALREDVDQTLSFLAKACAEGTSLDLLLSWPVMKGLKSDPGFQQRVAELRERNGH